MNALLNPTQKMMNLREFTKKNLKARIKEKLPEYRAKYMNQVKESISRKEVNFLMK